MSILGYIIIFSLASGLLALVGGVVLLAKESWVRKFSTHFVSFAVGALLATAFLDLLPEALEMAEAQGRHAEDLLMYVLGGILVFFVLEAMILKFHPHHHDDEGEHHHATPALLLIGDTIHNFIDGAVVAVAFLTSVPLGIITALAVAAHELPQEITDFSVMLHHGWKKSKVLWVNIFSSLAALIGAVIAFVSRDAIEPHLPELLAITAGIFIYIASTDLIPELSPHHRRDRTWHIFVLLALGVLLVSTLGAYLHEVLGY